MMPEEWPIATATVERNAPARDAGRARLSTVRLDFFLDPAERLTEQERALMTAMLHCLVGDIAAEIRAALPAAWVGANDDGAGVVEALTRSRLLDEPDLMGLLLRRADEERIGTGARARGGHREARVLQALVSSERGAVSAAAMPLVLARARRRDRFGQCLVAFDDLSRQTAERLVQAIAAALRGDIAIARGPASADSELSGAASKVLARHDESRSVDALMLRLVATLDESNSLTDDLFLAAAREGEVGFLAEVLARRAGVDGRTAFEELLSGTPRKFIALMRIAGISRDLSAGLLASLGDLLGIADPGTAIGVFDLMSPQEIQDCASWLRAAPEYRSALQRLGQANG